jgi:hypothetical protein
VAPPPACFVRWVMGPTARIRGLDGVHGEGSDGIDTRHIHALKYRGNGGSRCNAYLHSFPAAEGRKSSLDDAVMMTILLVRWAALHHQGSPKERRQTEGQLDMCTQG